MFDSFWHPAQASIPGNYVRYIWGTGRAAVFDCRKSPLDSKCNLRDGGMHVFADKCSVLSHVCTGQK